MMSSGKRFPVIWILFINSWIIVQGTPFKIPKLEINQNVHLMAILSNRLTNEKYHMKEDVAGLNTIQGRINITKGSKVTTIFYQEKNTVRLVLNENECQAYDFQRNVWSHLLPGVTSALENYLLLFGPSIYFRIITWINNSFLFWTQGPDQIVRGLPMNTKSIDFEGLKVTVSYLAEDDISKPSRVEFTGSLPPSVHSGTSNTEHLIIDFYTIAYTNEDLEKIVKPTPGIGCLNYLEVDQPLPEWEFPRINYVVVQYEGSTPIPGLASLPDNTNRRNMYIDIDNKIVHSSADVFGSGVRYILDYNLGTGYLIDKSGTCKEDAILADNPGWIDGQFNVKGLLWMVGPFKYLGETFYDRRSGILCKVWEAMQFNVKSDHVSYDKIVTTLYFTKVVSVGIDLPDYYAPVGMTKKGYKKDNSGAFILKLSQRQEIYEFSPAIADAEYRSLFQIAECFEDPSKQRSFSFDIRPKDNSRFNSSMAAAKDNLYTFRDELTKLIVKKSTISPLRLVSLDFDFSSERILAKGLFIEKPLLLASFQKRDIKVKLNDKKMYILRTRDKPKECLEMLAQDPDLRFALFCWYTDGMNSCVKVYDPSAIVEDSGGVGCELYERGISDFRRVNTEVSLAHLHDKLLSSLANETFAVAVDSEPYSVDSRNDFRVHDIFDQTMPDSVKTSEMLFKPLFSGRKMDTSLSANRRVEGSLRNFGDCYRACQNSDVGECEAFTYCHYADGKSDCIISHEEGTGDQVETFKNDAKCNVYVKSKISDYIRIKDREFRKEYPGNKPPSVFSAEECAWRCFHSKNCTMFEYGIISPCYVYSGDFDDSLTDESKFINDIYIAKKSSHFKLTGSVVAPKTMFTVVDLNYEQCADLCYDYDGGEDACRSFNYCPKGASVSSCQLVGGTGGTPIPSNGCYNYALKGKVDQPSVSSYTEEKVKSSGGKVFGIVLGFTFLGIVLGLLAQFLYLRHRRGAVGGSLISRRMTWSRQTEDDES